MVNRWSTHNPHITLVAVRMCSVSQIYCMLVRDKLEQANASNFQDTDASNFKMSNPEGPSSVLVTHPLASTSTPESSTAMAGGATAVTGSTTVMTGSSPAGPKVLATLLDTIRATVREEIQKQLPATTTIPGPRASGLPGVSDPSEVSVSESSGPTKTTGEWVSGVR